MEAYRCLQILINMLYVAFVSLAGWSFDAGGSIHR